MNAAPAGDLGDAVERLQNEQWHILELFDTYARHQRGPDAGASEDVRLVSLIYTLLRVHCELETMLHAVLADETGFEPALARTRTRRNEMLDALASAEALLPRDPAHVKEMAALDKRMRAWFQAEEQEVFALARRSRLDLAALDRDMAERQQALLSAGTSAGRAPAARASCA